MSEFNVISKEELKQMFIDIDAPAEIQMYFIELTNQYQNLINKQKQGLKIICPNCGEDDQTRFKAHSKDEISCGRCYHIF